MTFIYERLKLFYISPPEGLELEPKADENSKDHRSFFE